MPFKASLLFLAVLSLTGPSAHSAVVWSDEFDGPAIDSNIWTYDVGGWGFGNGQFEFNTARHENSYIEDGSLVIEARRESYSGNNFTSARMLTQGRFAFRYGSLEARIKLPDTANGLWPAFWMLGNNFPGIEWPGSGEVDIMEMGSKEGIAAGLQRRKINGALHFLGADDTYDNAVAWLDAAVDLNLDYHLYKLSWTPSEMILSLDGVPFVSWDISPDYLAEFHQPMYPILNLAVGGWDPSYTGVYSPAAVSAPFPAKMYVDWIRLTSNAFTEVILGAETEETGNFGVFAETEPVEHFLSYEDGTDPAFPYGDTAALFTWNNMTAATPPDASEGSESWSFDIAGGEWFGMGVLLPNFRNMHNYSDGTLHVDLRTTSSAPMKVGIKSSRGGEFWLPVGGETAEFGFPRDGEWHTVSIPLNRFANTDFRTIHQIFMIAGDPPAAALNLSIDNVWWEPSVDRPTPSSGSFGIYTESDANKDAGEFALGTDGDFFVWENTLVPNPQSPAEGAESISLKSAAGLAWFGAAFTPNVKHNLSAFDNPDGKLRFSMKTSSSTTFTVGMKSGNVDGIGQKWITFQAGSDPYGLVRDGQWHVVEIPVADLGPEVNFSEVSQLFQILGTTGPISDIELDDIYLAGGVALQTTVVASEIVEGVIISWRTIEGHDYAVQGSADLPVSIDWNTLYPSIMGDGTTLSVFDPIETSTPRFYRILQLP